MATHHVYLTLARHDDPRAVAGALAEGLHGLGYTPYDPFPGGSGPTALWTRTVRAFVEPARASWTRVLGELPPEALTHASEALGAPVLHLWLTSHLWGYLAFVEGAEPAHVEALSGLLKPGRSLRDVEQAMSGEPGNLALEPLEGIDTDDPAALPDEVQRLAETRGVDMDAAQRMIGKWTDRLFARLDRQGGGAASEMRDQASMALAPSGSLWETTHGHRLRAFAACLALPDGWHRPALEDVRLAFMAARRRAHRPEAPLLTSDEAALARVPDAADYLPLYFGIAE